jgi:cell division protein ZapA
VSKAKPIDIKIFNKVWKVNCPAGQEKELQESARYLDQKMREIKSVGRVIGLERIAIMAALNISHELLNEKKQKDIGDHLVSEQIERLQNKIDSALMDEETPPLPI